jgi:hypothetical protein
MRHKGTGYPGDPIAGARSDANRMLRQDERESRMRHADEVASFLDALIDSFEHRIKAVALVFGHAIILYIRKV